MLQVVASPMIVILMTLQVSLCTYRTFIEQASLMMIIMMIVINGIDREKPLQAKLRTDYLGLPLLLYPTVSPGIFYILFLLAYLLLSTF
jgi:hypothetical protein